MPNRMYIGARYVPLFIGEWDNTQSYEPLSIVTYNGDSYTSRQYVPIGANISNHTYWAKTSSNINTYMSDANVMKYGATPNTPNLDWETIFNSCVTNGNGIYFPNGTWIIDDEFSIPDCNYIYGDSAILSFTEVNSKLIASNDFNNRFFTMSGLKFDGNNIAENCFVFNSGNTGSINNCHFRNFKDTCINATVLGLVVENCSFIDTYARLDASNDFSMTGIKCLTDNVIVGCKFFGCKYGIKINGTSTITNCYFYGNCKNFKTNYAIYPNTNPVITYCEINSCEFDTIRYAFGSCQQVNIIACSFLWDSQITSGVNSIFYATSTYIAQKVCVDYCNFYTPSDSTSVEYTIKTFCSNTDFPQVTITSYSSEKCTKYIRHAVDNTHQFNITVGCIDGVTSGDLSKMIKLEAENNYTGTAQKRQIFRHEGDNLYIGLPNTIANRKAVYDAEVVPLTNPIAVGSNDRALLYVRGDGRTYSKIALSGTAYNMHYETVSETPTLDWSLNATLRS